MATLERVPPALLVSRFSGSTHAHEVRRKCFTTQAPKFLQDLVLSLGSAAAASEGLVRTDPVPYGSGTVRYDNPVLSIKLSENPFQQDGLAMQVTVGRAGCPPVLNTTFPIKFLTEKGALQYKLEDIRRAIAALNATVH